MIEGLNQIEEHRIGSGWHKTHAFHHVTLTKHDGNNDEPRHVLRFACWVVGKKHKNIPHMVV